MGDEAKERVLADIERRRGKVTDDHRFIAGHDPEFLREYEAIYEATLGEDVELPVRVREYVAIAILLTRGASDGGIERHMRRALAHGATIDELFQVVRAMILPGGAPVFNRGVSILRGIAKSEGNDGSGPDPS
ncbi:MAG TPA: carboxymuconolactone decarboxylase family protein [Trueperaceae bacterium]